MDIFSKSFSKTIQYIVAFIPVVSAIILFIPLISHYKLLLITATLSIVGVWLYERSINSSADYEGSFVSATAPDYIFASGLMTTAVEILFIIV